MVVCVEMRGNAPQTDLDVVVEVVDDVREVVGHDHAGRLRPLGQRDTRDADTRPELQHCLAVHTFCCASWGKATKKVNELSV